jgi:uncharacterized membrane protein
MDGKTKAIIAHVLLIGWVIALTINLFGKDEITSFYLRQTLILHLVIFLGWIPVFGWLFWILSLVMLLVSLIYAMKGEQKKIPILGKYFQEWFKAL